eukprot:Phypoly_transcript_10739.p1 GENE.Phypoly_transcript_10739~~Phypoly_transcript_10739.p1  ORF type:complete len:374 (+),score=41.20 Phypoly_transcript_10739:130-1251(+)
MNILSKALEEFAEKESEDFLCTICLGVPIPSLAVETVCCGNFFCRHCLAESRARKEICPNCNGSFASFPPRDVATGNKFAFKKLLGLLVYCESRFSGASTTEGMCEWRGAWMDVPAHLARCEHVRVNCGWNRCAVVVSRNSLRAHEAECEFRTISCEFCRQHLPYYELQKHLQTCSRFPIQCECGEPGIVRETHAYHTKYRCPDALLKCDLIGCPEMVKKRHFESHLVVCGYRMVSCVLCDVRLHFNALPTHLGVDCPRVLVNCPHACGIGPMLRGDVAAHLSTCQSPTVTCGFTGCPEKLPRNEIEKHMKESTAQHFQVLFQQVALLRQEVHTLSNTVKNHEKTISDLTIQNRMLMETTNCRSPGQMQMGRG